MKDRLEHLCGRYSIDGPFWDIEPCTAKERDETLAMSRSERAEFSLRVRQDAVDAYEAERARAPRGEDGEPLPTWKPHGLISQEQHRLEALHKGREVWFKLASKRGLEKPHPRAGARFVHENVGISLDMGTATGPLHILDAVSLLNRYPLLLEPYEAAPPKPVKIEREDQEPQSSGRRKRSRVNNPEA